MIEGGTIVLKFAIDRSTIAKCFIDQFQGLFIFLFDDLIEIDMVLVRQVRPTPGLPAQETRSPR